MHLVRLLFHIKDANTFVQGQPRGCVIYVVPNVQFRDQYLRRLRADAATSPDAYLLARHCPRSDIEIPPVERWRKILR